MTSRILAAGVCLLLGACGESPLAPDTPFRLIGHSDFGGLRIVEPTVRVIRASTEWDDFVRQAGLRAPSGRPEDPIPNVRFPREMAVALALGARPTSGYHVRVDRVSRERSRLAVHATEEISCGVVLQVVTYPMTVIAVPSTNAAVEAIWSKENRCQ
jgi:hypothetical protein